MDLHEPLVRIEKPTEIVSTSNLRDYDQARANFSWTEAARCLAGLPGGALNICHEALDRHLPTRAENIALRWLSKQGQRQDFSYRDLTLATARFARVLATLGIGRGERVFSLLGRVPDLYITALGTLRRGAVFCPLFSAFGPEPIHTRLDLGEACALVTTRALYEKKVVALKERLPRLRHVLLVREAGDNAPMPTGTIDLTTLLGASPGDFAPEPTRPDEVALLHFTSGTTGKPKGALHVHRAVLQHHLTARYALDLNPDDVFWCTADPGWVTGTSYGIIAPLTHGATLLVDEAELEPERWYQLLEREAVTVWYTAPTAVRMLMKAGDALPRKANLSRLRLIASVGEPLNPEAVRWGDRVLRRAIHDNWWQTETGGIMVANYRGMAIKPGSMGRPMPGVEAAVVVKNADGSVGEAPAGTVGELAIRKGWPSMFVGYLHDEARYQKCFAGPWYLSGDLATVDAEGYFWFVGRSDDVIKSSGHLIGPFEVESALLEHPAVAEAAVIGKPDAVAGELVKAFVSLKPGHVDGEALRRDILALARRRLGAVVAPKELEILASVPRTRSGKLMRRLLKARELGLPEGDLSTLEPS